MDLKLLLRQGLIELALSISEKAQTTLLAYLQYLSKWNQHYNLTSITDPVEQLRYHLLDSLSLAPFLQGPRILDVGTGAGFPGVPLALALPQYQFTLLDSNGKKIRFITQAMSELKILNVRPVQARAESFHEAAGFDDIISRAVSSLSAVLDDTQALLASGGQWLCMKGVYPTDELAVVQQPYRVERLKVPGVEAERHVVVIRE